MQKTLQKYTIREDNCRKSSRVRDGWSGRGWHKGRQSDEERTNIETEMQRSKDRQRYREKDRDAKIIFLLSSHMMLVPFRWFKADAALGELVPCIYPLHLGVWCSSACSVQFAMSATADLNVLNKSRAKFAAFLVTVFKSRVSEYTFTQKGSGKVITAHKVEAWLVGSKAESYCIGNVRGTPQACKSAASKFADGSQWTLSKVVSDSYTNAM